MAFCPWCCKRKSDRWRMNCIGVTTFILLLIGASLFSIYSFVFVRIIKEQSQLHEGTLLYPEWVEPKRQTVDIGFFMMNITNAEEFASQTPEKFVKPILQRTGPIVYRASIVKDNLQQLETSPKEIAYRQTFHFYYRPELSVGSKDDVINTINYFALSLGPLLDYLFSLPEAENIGAVQRKAAYAAVNRVIRDTNSTLIMKQPAGDILFGLRDPLYTAIVDILNNVLQNTSLAQYLPLSEEFGFFKILNNSVGWHYYQAYTGEPEYWLTNQITTLDGKKNLTYWFGDSCNMINGSDGTVRPPLGTREELVYHFYPSACRATYVKYVKDVDIKGVPGWEYRPPPEMFQAPARSQYNKCFCKEGSTELHCTKDGGLYMGPCTFGVPLYISAPHFLHGDGYFLSKLEGMDPPNEKYHSTVYTYEPNVGAAIAASKKLQFNIYVTPNEDITISRQIGETFVFPLFWLNGTYEVSDSDANILYGLIVVSEIVVICVQVVFLGVGTVLLVYLIYYSSQKKEKDEKISLGEPGYSNEVEYDDDKHHNEDTKKQEHECISAL